MPRIAHGTRDERGRWHAADPTLYPPMDVAGTLPWSVLDTTTPRWRERVAWWREQGVEDDIRPRAHARAMIATGRHARISAGVSRFDPHLAEVLTTWFSRRGDYVVDPFAGGPVRGLVAAHLDRHYLGFDLLADQVEGNRSRAGACAMDGLFDRMPVWWHGAAQDLLPTLDDQTCDLILTCPPYHNRERYSDHPADLSTMRWPAFLDTLGQIIRESLRVLQRDRFSVWVVSDVRDHRGHLRDLPGHVTRLHEAAGAHLTNELVLINSAGLLAKTMRPAWEAARTTTRRHQLVLIFVRGDRRRAAAHVQGLG